MGCCLAKSHRIMVPSWGLLPIPSDMQNWPERFYLSGPEALAHRALACTACGTVVCGGLLSPPTV